MFLEGHGVYVRYQWMGSGRHRETIKARLFLFLFSFVLLCLKKRGKRKEFHVIQLRQLFTVSQITPN